MTLDDIKAACAECGDCWEWQWACSKAGVPKVGIGIDGKRTVISARRLVWSLVKGPLPPKKLLTTKCGNPKCLNPDHLKITSHAEVARKNGARIETKLKRALAQSNYNRSHKAKLTMEQVLEIRSSEEDPLSLSLKMGVSRSCVQRVRAGLTWKDYSNPFAGLL